MDSILKDPASVFSGKANVSDILRDVKRIVDPITPSNSVLDEIHIDGLLPSQVWGQVKLVVDGVNDTILKEGLGSQHDEDEHDGHSDEEPTDDHGDDEKQSHSDDSGEENSNKDEEDDDSDNKHNNQHNDQRNDQHNDEDTTTDATNDDQHAEVDYKPPKDVFGLNDDVFSIDQYNQQVKALDKSSGLLNEDGDDEQIDLFADIPDDSGEEMEKYDDFFKPIVEKKQQHVSKSKKQPADASKLEDSEYEDAVKELNDDLAGKSAGNDEHLSSFEKQQEVIKKEISTLEDEAVADKKWTMQGEASVKQRAKDSLLDEELQFERTAKPVPVITQQVTEDLDELIRQRIKDERFDEVQKRIVTVKDYRPVENTEVSQEKSNKSLAQEYEDDYMNKQTDQAAEELQKAHDEVSALFAKVNHKLDALCSAHFVPKPAEKLLDVKVQTSAIAMEDAQPLTMSSADTLAPQEVYKLKNMADKKQIKLRSGVVMSRDELSREERRRLRRAKKRKIKNKQREKAEKKSMRVETEGVQGV